MQFVAPARTKSSTRARLFIQTHSWSLRDTAAVARALRDALAVQIL